MTGLVFQRTWTGFKSNDMPLTSNFQFAIIQIHFLFIEVTFNLQNIGPQYLDYALDPNSSIMRIKWQQLNSNQRLAKLAVRLVSNNTGWLTGPELCCLILSLFCLSSRHIVSSHPLYRPIWRHVIVHTNWATMETSVGDLRGHPKPRAADCQPSYPAPSSVSDLDLHPWTS